MQRLRARVRGVVQGVSFRWYTEREATALGLEGWVRNCPDGTVEVVAEGPAERLDALAAWCRRGPPSARVDAVELERGPARGGLGVFRVRR